MDEGDEHDGEGKAFMERTMSMHSRPKETVLILSEQRMRIRDPCPITWLTH